LPSVCGRLFGDGTRKRAGATNRLTPIEAAGARSGSETSFRPASHLRLHPSGFVAPARHEKVTERHEMRDALEGTNSAEQIVDGMALGKLARQLQNQFGGDGFRVSGLTAEVVVKVGATSPSPPQTRSPLRVRKDGALRSSTSTLNFNLKWWLPSLLTRQAVASTRTMTSALQRLTSVALAKEVRLSTSTGAARTPPLRVA